MLPDFTKTILGVIDVQAAGYTMIYNKNEYEFYLFLKLLMIIIYQSPLHTPWRNGAGALVLRMGRYVEGIVGLLK